MWFLSLMITYYMFLQKLSSWQSTRTHNILVDGVCKCFLDVVTNEWIIYTLSLKEVIVIKAEKIIREMIARGLLKTETR